MKTIFIIIILLAIIFFKNDDTPQSNNVAFCYTLLKTTHQITNGKVPQNTSIISELKEMKTSLEQRGLSFTKEELEATNLTHEYFKNSSTKYTKAFQECLTIQYH